MKAVFLGTPEIAVKPLEYLCAKNDVEICAIVTQPDRPSGRVVTNSLLRPLK